MSNDDQNPNSHVHFTDEKTMVPHTSLGWDPLTTNCLDHSGHQVLQKTTAHNGQKQQPVWNRSSRRALERCTRQRCEARSIKHFMKTEGF